MSLDPAGIPPAVREVIEQLGAGGYRAVLVGGSVRDLLLGKTPKDFDVATSARPEQVQACFRRVIPTGIEHGTVTVVHRGAHVEVTTFRAEADYVDGRRPSRVEFHEDVEADLSRRDFTINAMAWDPRLGIVDPFGGQGDLVRRVVRCVRLAVDRFSEDGLRPLRAVRFATVLGFSLEAETEAAIPSTLSVFKRVALERVHQEFVKILASPRVEQGLGLLASTGLLGAFLPEAHASRFKAVAACPIDEPIRLAALLAGASSVRQPLLRLKFPNKVADEADALNRLRELPPVTASDAALRRFLAATDPNRLEALLALNAADAPVDASLSSRLRALAQLRPPLTAKDLVLDGRAIMAVLDVGPSKAVGDATRYLVDCVLDDPSTNTIEALTALLKGWKSSH